jgi:hypothetical protein
VARVRDARLYPLGSMAVVVSGRVMFAIDDRGLRQDPAWHKGFSGTIPVSDNEKSGYDVLGGAPDSIWIQAWVQGGSTSDPMQALLTLRWTGSMWGEVKPLEGEETLLGVVPIGKGRFAGLVRGAGGELRWIPGNTKSAAVPRAPEPAEDGASPAASASTEPVAAPPASAAVPAVAAPDVSGSASAAPAAAPSASASDAPAAPPKPPVARLKVDAPFFKWMNDDDQGLFPRGVVVSGSASGAIVLVGRDSKKGGELSVERWEKAGAKSVVEPLPPPDPQQERTFGVLAVSEREAWVYGTSTKAYLAHFDGSSWKVEAPPGKGSIRSMAAGEGGSVYIVVDGGVFQRAPQGREWAAVALPAEAGSAVAAASVAGKLWVLTSSSLLGPAASTEVIELPSVADTAAAREDLLRYPLTSACTRPFVLLKSRVSPAAKTFPEVEEVVKKAIPLDGVELVTEISEKWTYLGASVPSVSLGRKLASAMNAADSKAGAALYCHAPRAVKKIPLSP